MTKQMNVSGELTKTQKTFFIIATVLCAAAIVFGIIGIYFGVSGVAALASPKPGDSLGGALLMVIMLLFMLLTGCLLVASVPFYIAGPFRAPRCRLRRIAVILLLVEAAVFLCNVALFVIGFVIA